MIGSQAQWEQRENPNARTSIDDCTTPLEDAEILGLTAVAEALRKLTG